LQCAQSSETLICTKDVLRILLRGRQLVLEPLLP
jgi:hypothetical protein